MNEHDPPEDSRLDSDTINKRLPESGGGTRDRKNRRLLARIERRIQEAADEAFDYDDAIDSDGLDQAQRDGLLQALQIVQEEFAR